MSNLYILEGKTPRLTNDILEYGKWLTTAERHVGDTTIDDVRVSTVFLGIDHNFRPGGRPVLFETMVFGGDLDMDCVRYCTWGDAEKGHEEMCRKVREGNA